MKTFIISTLTKQIRNYEEGEVNVICMRKKSCKQNFGGENRVNEITCKTQSNMGG
jgi:hypothetical protein